MGTMSIRVTGGPNGGTNFNVEEYKRPKFQVKVEAPEVAPKLNGEVVVKGVATAYTGAAVNGAKVSYRVVRQTRYPIWWRTCYWWRPFPATPSQEIDHGTLTTEADGSFVIKFTAKPDLSVPEEDEPTFRFTVHADVTDTTGETRSGDRSVNVGYTALKASLSAGSWLTTKEPIAVTVTTQTLDGEPQAAEGTLKIYKLKAPEKVQRGPLQGHRHWMPHPMPIVRKGGRIVAPDLPPTGDPNTWPLGEVAAEEKVETGAEGTAKAEFDLPVGAYRAILETRDRFGKAVQAQLPLTVLDPDAKKLAIKVPQIVNGAGVERRTRQGVHPRSGERAMTKAAPTSKSSTARRTSRPTGRKPAKPRCRSSRRSMKRCAADSPSTSPTSAKTAPTSPAHKVDVPWTNKNLTVKWEHFVNKLEPGKKETWTAVVTGPDAKKAVAEMVAGLYDASLDAYRPHAWMQAFNVFRQDYSNLQLQFQNQVKHFQHFHGNWPHRHFDGTLTYRHYPGEILGSFYWARGRDMFGGRGMLRKGMADALRRADGRLPRRPRRRGGRREDASISRERGGREELRPSGPAGE